MVEWQPVILSIKVASISVVFVFVLGVLSAYVMRTLAIPGKAVLESFFTLPLVLPPVVIGFLLLVLVGNQGPIGIVLKKYFNTFLNLLCVWISYSYCFNTIYFVFVKCSYNTTSFSS